MIRWFWVLLFGRGCEHAWRALVERELPSKAEELTKNGERLSTWNATWALERIASKTFVSVVCCDKCGALKVIEIRT